MHSLSLGLSSLLLSLLALPIAADDFRSATTQANTFVASDQAAVTLDVDSAGNFVLAWDSRRQEGGNYGVLARRFDPIGRPLTEEISVNAYTDSAQSQPAVAVAPDGTSWIVWTSFRQDGEGLSVVARRFSPALCPMTSDILVNTTCRGNQSSPAVAVSDSGEALIVWTSQSRGTAPRVMARLLAADGAPQGPELALGSPREGERDTLPTLAAWPAGFRVAWARTDESGVPMGIFTQALSRSAAPIENEWPVAEDPRHGGIEPAIAADADGAFAIAWMRVYAARYVAEARWFAANAQPRGSTQELFGSASATMSGVALDMRGGRTLVACNEIAGEDIEVVARLFDNTGKPLGAAMPVSAGRPGRQALRSAAGSQRVAISPFGALAIGWDGDAGQGDKTAATLTVLAPSDWYDRVAQTPVPTFEPRQVDLSFAAAEPHIPPTFDPNLVEQPPLDSPLRNGPDFGFQAFGGTGWTPPDPESAVGPNHIVTIVNGRIRFFDKSGTQLFNQVLEGSSGFFGSVGATSFVFDPEALWDPFSNRFWMMACERSSDTRSFFLVAVSDDSDPVGTWFKYRLDVTALAGTDIDSPNMSVDDEAVYLTADFFTGGDKYLVYMLNKSQAISGVTPSATSLLISGSQSYGVPVNYDAAAPAQYMIQTFESSSNNSVRFHALRNPLTTPTRVTTDLTLPVPYRYPGSPTQQGTTVTPILFEPRVWSCLYRDGSLWAIHHTRRTGENQTIARWYEFAMNGWPTSGSTPTVAQWGEIDAGPALNCYFPSIGVDAFGNAAITFARSGSAEYISMWRALRRAEDAPGTFRPVVLVQASSSAYTTNRWGDYSKTQDDPADPCRFWGHHEWTVTANNWRTWMSRYDNFSAADFDENGQVDAQDLALLLSSFLVNAGGDIDGDSDTDSQDLALLLSAWGPTCP